MARKKVKLEWIANNSFRHVTLRKRRNGLLKKASELSVLCDVKACAVIYDPEKPKTEVWPSESEATEILQDLKTTQVNARGVDQEGFLRQRNVKLHQQLLRMQVQNKQLEMKALMVQGIAGTRRLNNVSFEDAAIMRRLIVETTKELRQRIGDVKAQTERANETNLNLLMNGSYPSSVQNVPCNSSGGGFENVMNNGSNSWMYQTVWMQPYILNNWMDPSVFPFGHL